jgi:large subunit ribosomal protein L5
MSESKDKAKAKPRGKGKSEAQSEATPETAAKGTRPTRSRSGPARLRGFYQSTVVPQLTKQFGYKSPMQVPRISKITLNMGVGEAVADKKVIDHAVEDMRKISGQKPLVTRSRKSISNFKIREDLPIGCKVTLRRERMYEFLDRLITIAIPRIRDFRGLSPRSFDGRGNYSLGVKEQIIFPEIDFDKIDAIRGLDITITTTAASDEEGRALLAAFNFPLRT